MACKRSAVRSCLSPPKSRSSRGLGHRPFTAVTGVRIPYGMPLGFEASCHFSDCYSVIYPKSPRSKLPSLTLPSPKPSVSGSRGREKKLLFGLAQQESEGFNSVISSESTATSESVWTASGLVQTMGDGVCATPADLPTWGPSAQGKLSDAYEAKQFPWIAKVMTQIDCELMDVGAEDQSRVALGIETRLPSGGLRRQLASPWIFSLEALDTFCEYNWANYAKVRADELWPKTWFWVGQPTRGIRPRRADSFAERGLGQ
jgi:hypothetical protein